jgi:hypothetical protein
MQSKDLVLASPDTLYHLQSFRRIKREADLLGITSSTCCANGRAVVATASTWDAQVGAQRRQFIIATSAKHRSSAFNTRYIILSTFFSPNETSDGSSKANVKNQLRKCPYCCCCCLLLLLLLLKIHRPVLNDDRFMIVINAKHRPSAHSTRLVMSSMFVSPNGARDDYSRANVKNRTRKWPCCCCCSFFY